MNYNECAEWLFAHMQYVIPWTSVRQHGHGALVAIFTDPCEAACGLDSMKTPLLSWVMGKTTVNVTANCRSCDLGRAITPLTKTQKYF